MGLYEAHLQSIGRSPNSIRNALSNTSYLHVWGQQNGVDVESSFLSGECLMARDIRAFTHWLRYTYLNRHGDKLSIDTVRSIIAAARAMTTYFVQQYYTPQSGRNERASRIALVIKSQQDVWTSVLPRTHRLPVAPDLSDEEIATIDGWLDPARRIESGVRPEVAARDQLIWRLVRVGLRIGEVLALRVGDCPQLRGELLDIVRIEERGQAYTDPRLPYAPRPKTLSRELGVHLYDAELPYLLARYISHHRCARRQIGQNLFIDWELGHDFLIISQNSGQPLSIWTAQDIADQISNGTGVKFHWHVARHAFFNRRYAEIADLPNYPALRTDLLYWGGWRNPQSLDIYTRRAVAARAAGMSQIYRDQFGGDLI